MYYTDNDFRLYHHGILGQKWGVRRFQNADGSLTAAGRKRVRESHGKIESAGSRINRSVAGARLTAKIDRLEGKKYSDKRQAKIEKLKSLRDQKLSDLSENEIKYGKMYLEEYTRQNKAIRTGVIVGGIPGGVLAAAGYSAARHLTKSGKEFNEDFKKTAKVVDKENRDRIADEKFKNAGKEIMERQKIREESGEKLKQAPKMSKEDFDDYSDNRGGSKRLSKDYAEYSKAYDKEKARESGSDFDGDKFIKNTFAKDYVKASRARTDEEHDELLRKADNKGKSLQNALKNDMYNLDFLEYTQNNYDDMSPSEAREKRLKDYERYLDDPDEFLRRR